MNARERTEKIIRELVKDDPSSVDKLVVDRTHLGWLISAQIDEAEQAVLVEAMKIDDKTSKDCYAEGFYTALEQAAKIAETGITGNMSDIIHELIAEKIRAMKLPEAG